MAKRTKRPPVAATTTAEAPFTPGVVFDPPASGINAKQPLEALLAPPPQIDRFPYVIGQGLSLGYLSSVYRLCTQGLRYQFVDLLNELIEHDPHARGVIRQRVLAVAGARIEVVPAKCEEADKPLADKICKEVDRQLAGISGFRQSIGALAWGGIYGLSGAENMWERTDVWEIQELQLRQSRRLNYPTPDTWDVHIWDQGSPLPVGDSALRGGRWLFGLRCKDFPGKFTIHAPQLSGDYPTRDGEGRFIAAYLLIKRMVVRALGQDFERTIRPWVIGLFNREGDKDRKTVAKEGDIARLKEAVDALGLGSLNSAVLPDACKIELLRAASTHNPQEFLEWLDGQTSKGVLGQTYTTEPGENGARAASEVGERGTELVAKYDAGCLCDTLERDVVRWIVRLNWGDDIARRLSPRLILNVEDEDSPNDVLARAEKATKIDIPVDIDQLAERIRLPVIPREKGDTEPRRTRLVAAGKDQPVEPDATNDPNDPNYVEPEPEADGGDKSAEGAPAKAAPKPKGAKGATSKKTGAKAPTPTL